MPANESNDFEDILAVHWMIFSLFDNELGVFCPFRVCTFSLPKKCSTCNFVIFYDTMCCWRLVLVFLYVLPHATPLDWIFFVTFWNLFVVLDVDGPYFPLSTISSDSHVNIERNLKVNLSFFTCLTTIDALKALKTGWWSTMMTAALFCIFVMSFVLFLTRWCENFDALHSLVLWCAARFVDLPGNAHNCRSVVYRFCCFFLPNNGHLKSIFYWRSLCWAVVRVVKRCVSDFSERRFLYLCKFYSSISTSESLFM